MVQVIVPISTRGCFNGHDLIPILTKLWTFGLDTLELTSTWPKNLFSTLNLLTLVKTNVVCVSMNHLHLQAQIFTLAHMLHIILK
jgi:hypothetical protein